MKQKSKYLSDYGRKKSLKNKGVVIDSANRNKLITSGTKENWKHFMCKAACFYTLRMNGQECLSEAEVENGIADIYWVDEKTVIEFEKNGSNKADKLKQYESIYVNDVFVFVLDKIPDDFYQAVHFLKKQLGLEL